MLRALLRKQWLQWFNVILTDRRNGKRRSGFQMLLYAILFIYLFCVLAGGTYWLCRMLCPTLHTLGLDWLYFTLMGMVALVLGAISSLFSTLSGLYQAKDNDFLFSLPISPRLILFSRMVNSYIMGVIPMMIVVIPTLVAYAQFGMPSVRNMVFSILLVFILGFGALFLSCLLGWVLAIINRRIQHKNLITVLLSLAFMGLYFYGYSRISELLQSILSNVSTISENIKGGFYPFYLMGKAFEGDSLSMLLFTGLIALIFGLTYWILSLSFLKLSIAQGTHSKRKAYQEESLTSAPLERALLRKEAKRLLSSPTYLLNASLGLIFCCVCIVVLLLKMNHLQELLRSIDNPILPRILPVALAGALAALSCMNMISSSSISMEGKNLWILRSLPVPTWKILKTKWNFHMLLTLTPMCILYIIVMIACHIPLAESLLILLFFTTFIGFSATIGLNANLRKPNLTWTNETAAVKENFGSLLCLLAEWGILGFFTLAYIGGNKLFAKNGELLQAIPFLIFISACMLLLFGISMYRLKHKGIHYFENI